MAFETSGSDPDLLSEHHNYFDLETGRVVFMTDDISSALDRIEEELEDQLPPDGHVTADMLRAMGFPVLVRMGTGGGVAVRESALWRLRPL